MMAATAYPEEPDKKRSPQFDDELVGLDPDDPEAQAFAEHLERQQQVRSGYTVEGYLSDVGDFADSANRLGGHHKLMAGILVLLILLGVTITAWDALVFVVATFFH
jgi:hypothetical protein